ncbi:MAG: diaminopimelate decarboxylase [Chloroflexota bacterium]
MTTNDWFWWQRPDLGYVNGRLHLQQHNLQALAESAGTPTYAYSSHRFRANWRRLAGVLTAREVPHKLFFALKSNRFLPLLTFLRLHGECGVDVCSPSELLLARQVGFAESDITYTNTAVSNADLDIIARHPGIQVNCDALSTIRRLGERSPGRAIGLRINPELGLGYHDALHYAGVKTTKFGIYLEHLPEAMALAKQYGMPITRLHFHAGSGYLSPQLETFARILVENGRFLDQLPDVTTVNIGGGLGLKLTADGHELDLERWGDLLANFAKERGVTIQAEPGDYLIKDAGVLLLQVAMVERKKETLFVGVNGGFNLQPLSVYYQTPFVVVPTVLRQGAMQPTTVVGNINEGIDIWAENIPLPPLVEGDTLAFLNVGGYGSAMSSNHCMRGQFSEYLLVD